MASNSTYALASLPLLWRAFDEVTYEEFTDNGDGTATVALSGGVSAQIAGNFTIDNVNNAIVGDVTSVTVLRGNGNGARTVIEGDMYINTTATDGFTGTVNSVQLVTPSGNTPVSGTGLNLDVETLISAAKVDSTDDNYNDGANNFGLILDGTIESEVIAGSDGDDVITAGNGNDTVNSGNGNDIVFGGDGYIDGDDGNDVIWGGQGYDQLYGNAGDDVLYANAEGNFTDTNGNLLHGGAGNDIAYGASGNDLIVGSAGSDMLYGEAGADTIYGGNGFIDPTDGADTMFGGDGNDALYGNGGDDLIFGGNGNDDIFGGSGNDTLVGGQGYDRLFGNGGSDTFAFEANAETGLIVDFESGVDVLSFQGRTVTQVLEAFTTVDGGSVIDFGDGNLIALANVDTLTVADISVY